MAILTNSDDLVRAANMNWQQHMKFAVRTLEELSRHVELPLNSICNSRATTDFPLFVPLPFLSRIRKMDPQDPLLLQVLPTNHELEASAGFSTDPLNESEHTLAGGLLQKYRGRALLVVNGTCAVHCRYCFRRHFPYDQSNSIADKWQPALDSIRQDDSIHEIILSGGDPLTLVDEQIGYLIDQLNSIEHLKRLRIHTRLPIVIPQRITQQLVQALNRSNQKVVFVVHSNHANEIDDQVVEAIGRLTANSIPVLNQAVLLKGINDSVPALMGLSERLVEAGALPYYLHQLDPVSGAAHFEVPVEQGIELVKQVRSRLSGYMVPKFVREISGELNKTVLA